MRDRHRVGDLADAAILVETGQFLFYLSRYDTSMAYATWAGPLPLSGADIYKALVGSGKRGTTPLIMAWRTLAMSYSTPPSFPSDSHGTDPAMPSRPSTAAAATATPVYSSSGASAPDYSSTSPMYVVDAQIGTVLRVRHHYL